MLCLILISLAAATEAVFNDEDVFHEAETVFPKLLSRSSAEVHASELMYEIVSSSKKFLVNLQKDKNYQPRKILLGEQMHTPLHCYYTGTVDGESDSYAFISTCSGGLTGVIEDSNTTYDIMPMPGEDGAHMLRDVKEDMGKTAEFLKNSNNEQVNEFKDAHIERLKRKRRSTIETAIPFELVDVEPQYLPYLNVKHTRYIEALVSVGNGMYNFYKGDGDVILERVMNTMLQVDRHFSAINMRFVVVAIDIQETPQHNRSSDYGSELNLFHNYYKKLLNGKYKQLYHNVDTALLLSSTSWKDSAVGGANVNAMCRWGGVSVNYWPHWRIAPSLHVIGHEVGHVLSFPHDYEYCKCLTPDRGCNMGGFESARLGFSNCSLVSLAHKSYNCLNNYPTMPMYKFCGNGILEKDEECDCGSPEMCAKKKDTCCEPFTCRLKKHVQCSYVNHPECCNQQCLFRSHSTVCREATGPCDFIEVCTGKSAECPADEFPSIGGSCDEHVTRLMGLRDGKEHTNTLSPEIIAKYVKVIPIVWKSSPCVIVKLAGCKVADADTGCSVDITNIAKFTAESSRNSGTNTAQEWCPSSSEDTWFMFEFNEAVDLRAISMKRISNSEFLQEYRLQYSDDGYIWTDYRETGDNTELKGSCYKGKCVKSLENQCKDVWGWDARMSAAQCWSRLNTITNAYGTCSPTFSKSCQTKDMYCGQLQCYSDEYDPIRRDFGFDFTTFTFGSTTCKATKVHDPNSDEVGNGMVEDGTVCGKSPDGLNMVCLNQQCRKHTDVTKICPIVNGKECNENGVCTNEGVCHCYHGYDPKNDCLSTVVVTDGGWGEWTEYDLCSSACAGGIQARYRYCDSPTAEHGGAPCDGEWKEERECNMEACPLLRSCKELQTSFKESGKPLIDGIYTLQLSKIQQVKTYCDMTRNGGGWTLVVASTHIDWTAQNVWEKNIDKPSLYGDYSMLKHADLLVESIYVSKVQYRLEADTLGKWGGIFETRATYSFSSQDGDQTDVKLVEKFNEWSPSATSIDDRVPYVYKHLLTTSSRPDNNQWGSVTDNRKGWHPSKWIRGYMKMEIPEHVWYWIREGDKEYLSSCAALKYERGLPSGEYYIKLSDGIVVKTYCEMKESGGGWSLLASVHPHSQSFDNSNIDLKISDSDLLISDFSILKYWNDFKTTDVWEREGEVMIKSSDGVGGIFKYSKLYDIHICGQDKSTKPALQKKFGEWDEAVENIAKYPICMEATDKWLLYSKASESEGVLLSKDGKSGTFISTSQHPQTIHVFVRSGGTFATCIDLLKAAVSEGEKLSDGVYPLSTTGLTPCPMTSLPEYQGCYSHSKSYFGTFHQERDNIDWNDMTKTISACAKNVRLKAPQAMYFGIVYYGECWYGNDAFEGKLSERPDGCWANVGDDNTMALYKYVQ